MKCPKRARAKARGRTVKSRRWQTGGTFDIQKWISKMGVKFHWLGYQYKGPGTKLTKWLKRRDPVINRLDNLAKQHDIDYGKKSG